MGLLPVDEVDAVNTVFKCANRAVSFWDHTFADGAVFDQRFNLVDSDRGNERLGVIHVTHQARHIAEVNEATRAQRRSHPTRSGVGVRVVDLAVIVTSHGRDDGDVAVVESFFDNFSFYGMRLAHETEVKRLTVHDNFFLIANEDAIAR